MDTRNRTTSLDVAKCLAAFLVVAIHADFPGMFGKYVNAWARIAGPLFFIISGYYYPILASQGKQKRQIRKLLKYLLIGSTVFIVYECTVAALKGNLSECLNIWITSGTIAKFLFFNAFPFAGHLWYMYALLYVYAILNLFKLWKLPEKTTGIIIIILLIFNYILSFFPEYYSYRNFLFTGLPYVLLGCLIRKKWGLASLQNQCRVHLLDCVSVRIASSRNSHVPFHRLDAAQGPLSIHIPAKPLRVLLCLGQCRLRKQKHGRCYRAAILFLYLYVPSPCHKPVLKHSMAVPKQTLRFYPAHRGLHSHDSLHNTNPGPLLRNPKNKAAPHFLKPPCFLLKNC